MTLPRLFALLLLALLCAGVSNLIASRERRLSWVGEYPSALTVPPARQADPAPYSPAPPTAPADAVSPPASAKDFPPHPDSPALEISPSDADLLYGRKALFLDARRSKVYQEGHIRGARSFPVWESDVEERIKAFFEEGQDPNQPIVIYCSGGNCEDSHMLAQKLYMAGFDNALVYKDGFPDWEKRGQPIEKGPPR